MIEFSCKCQKVTIGIAENAPSNRLSCCCNSCRGYSKFMGEEGRLDEFGAVELFQTTPEQVKILKGQDQLQAHMISEKGLMRWSCASCQTHIANTLQRSKIAFIGLAVPREYQQPAGKELGQFLGWVQQKDAPGAKPEQTASFFKAGMKIMWRSLWAKKSSDWADNGNWIVTPQVMSADDRTKLYELAKTC